MVKFTVVNRTYHGGSINISLTVPLRKTLRFNQTRVKWFPGPRKNKNTPPHRKGIELLQHT